MRKQHSSTLFPYTTLFRSRRWSEQLSRPRGCICSASSFHLAVAGECPAPSSTRRIMKSVGSQSHTDSDFSAVRRATAYRSEEHTSELQSHSDLVCRLLLEK